MFSGNEWQRFGYGYYGNDLNGNNIPDGYEYGYNYMGDVNGNGVLDT